MRKEITNPVGKWWVVSNRCGDLHVTDGDMPEKAGSGWQGMNNDYEWTSATDDVFKDCVIPATTFDKGPLQFEIDEWNTSDEETDDSTWIGEFDLRATYGVGFVESLPDIANGEMTEIRIKYTAEKCE